MSNIIPKLRATLIINDFRIKYPDIITSQIAEYMTGEIESAFIHQHNHNQKIFDKCLEAI